MAQLEKIKDSSKNLLAKAEKSQIFTDLSKYISKFKFSVFDYKTDELAKYSMIFGNGELSCVLNRKGLGNNAGEMFYYYADVSYPILDEKNRLRFSVDEIYRKKTYDKNKGIYAMIGKFLVKHFAYIKKNMNDSGSLEPENAELTKLDSSILWAQSVDSIYDEKFD